MINILFRKNFFFFFICQFCGAFNDNIFRLTLIAMLSFGVLKSDASGVFIQLAAAIFMLPFFLFSAIAGDITDKVSKRSMLIGVKAAELLIMSIAAAALYFQSLPLIMLCLFLTGMQSAFFGPIKYALLPTLVQRSALLDANAWFRVSTFAAILLGTFLGTVSGKSAEAAGWISGGIVLLSCIGLFSAVNVSVGHKPAAAAADISLRRSFAAMWRAARAEPYVFHCIIAGSWFWLVGALLLNELAQVPYTLYIMLLTAVLAGVMLGALLCYFIFRGDITNKYAPRTLLTGALALLVISQNINDGNTTVLLTATLGFAAVMTVYVVPLAASIQARSPESSRAKIIAAYNIINALFIVVATVAAAGLHAVSDNASEIILLLTALLNLAGTLLVWRIVPVETIRSFLLPILKRLFKVRVEGGEHLESRGVFIANHQSFLDGLLIGVFLQNERHQFIFPIAPMHAERFIVRQGLKLVHSYPLDSLDPHNIRPLIRDFQKGKDALSPLVFPEGRLTTTGGIMKMYPGAATIAEKINGGRITPIIIDGSQYSTVSRLRGKFPLLHFPQITLRVFPPHQLQLSPPGLRGAERRQQLANQIASVMENCLFETRHATVNNLTRCFADSCRQFGSGATLFRELPEAQLTFRKTYISAIALGSILQARHTAGDRIGLMLPSSMGAAVTFYASIFHRLIPVMLNPSVGSAQALSSCRTATLETVYTSQRLLENSPATVEIVETLKAAGIKIVLLEELRQVVTAKLKLKAALSGLFLPWSIRRLPGYHAGAEEHAVVLFTSGSEGMPKGVVLSHKNLVTNCQQVLTRIAISPCQDVMLNALPIFHVFGLLAGFILPVCSGVKTYQYPSPLHYKIIPELLYNWNITIFFSANTFLYHYGKAAHPYDCHNLRLVFAGAEKLRDETRQLWTDKFGIRLLEGYGVTETSPALAVNTPLHNLTGSTGRILPGIEARLEPVEGIERGGRLWVRGDNVMAGYFTADAPGQIKPPADGWHDTGDIADINPARYLTILGRAKRFIKVAGEMVPLDRIQDCLQNHWEGLFVAVGIADKKRGESLALVSTVELTREDIARTLKQEGLPELWQPRRLLVVKEMPLLSTGKIDYPAVSRLLNAPAADEEN